MSGPFGSSQWMYNAGDEFYPTTIDNSLRFNGSNSTLTKSVSHNRKTFTISFWAKRSNVDRRMIYGAYNSGTSTSVISIDTNGLAYYNYVNGYTAHLRTNALLRDVSAWYHVVLSVDTTQSTSSDRVKLYVNGEQVTSFLYEVYPSQNSNMIFGSGITHAVGTEGTNTRLIWDGYLADYCLIDGTALGPDSFGEFKSGIWVAKDVSGLTFGSGGYHLKFDGNTNDSSGNSNNWTGNNISSHDYMPDSPTNNFNTFSTNIPSNSGSRSEGNLKSSSVTGGSSNYGPMSCYNVHSGKWYFEFRITGGTAKDIYAGAFYARLDNTIRFGKDMAIVYDGLIYGGGSIVQTGLTKPATNDVFGFAVNVDNSTCQIYRNGSTYGNLVDFSSSSYVSNGFMGMGHYHGSSSNNSTVVVNYGQDSTFAGATTAGGNADDNGLGDFKYAPPAGFLAMCSANLPELAIDPANDDTPADYFDTALYAGDNTNDKKINLGFQPDLLWIRARNSSSEWGVFDSVRGESKVLRINSNASEVTSPAGKDLSSFDSDGFTVDQSNWIDTNTANRSQVAFSWKAGGTAVSNTDGSVTTSVSANAEAGFSIATYTGNATAGATVGHGLGVAPDVVLIKARARSGGGSDWPMYHRGIPNSETGWIRLNLNNAWSSTSILWNNTAPSSSVVTLGSYDYVNDSGTSHVMYSFASKEGYSKFGSYTGNGSSDGAFIHTGFRPAWVMIKCTNAAESWNVFDVARDTSNLTTQNLNPNVSNAESDASSGNRAIDILSNGFKCRGNNSSINNGSYIYMAFAEQPFKYANAR